MRFRGAKYWIDPDKCIECGLCAENCHNCIITKEGAEPAIPAPHEPTQMDCDVVVCGAGGSGLGSRRQAGPAGQAGHCAGEKRPGRRQHLVRRGLPHPLLQKAPGGRRADTRDEQIRKFLIDTLWKEDPQLVYNVYQATEGLVDWLMEDCDCGEDFRAGHHPLWRQGHDVREQDRPEV